MSAYLRLHWRAGSVDMDRHEQFEVRQIALDDADYNVALHMILGGAPRTAGPAWVGPVADLVANVAQRRLSMELLFGAYLGTNLVAACVAIESPGSAALVLLPGSMHGSEVPAATAALAAMQAAAKERSIKLLEALIDPASDETVAALAAAGFRFLTRLVYLRRANHVSRAPSRTPPELRWVSFRAEHEALFREGLERTYVQSLDCPELTGVRETAEVLAGHRATGEHDPALWWVGLRSERPEAVLLLSRIPSDHALEIVYAGVAQPLRGTGIADELMRLAVNAVRTEGIRWLTLAVDERNLPARRLYARWNFTTTGMLHAWIASPDS